MSEDQLMRSLGFTDHREGFWYLCRDVGDGTTLNVTIDKVSGSWEELVMNEAFGQPEFYGRMKPEFRDVIRANVDRIVAELNVVGIPVRVDHSEYGCDVEVTEGKTT